MFLVENDYRVVCNDADLDIITQSSDEIRQQAERIAQDEVAGYVRSRYDIDAAFAAQGDERSPLLVQITVNIALYYLAKWLPQYMGGDVRMELYENAINRLKDIQKGAFTPDLPTYKTEDGDEATGAGSTPMSFGSMSKQHYDY